MNGISKAFDTKPGTSLDTVTSLSHATANARARDNVSSDVCNAEISSTSFYTIEVRLRASSWMHVRLTIAGTGLKKWSPDQP